MRHDFAFALQGLVIMENQLFQAALDIADPCCAQEIGFDADRKALAISIDSYG